MTPDKRVEEMTNKHKHYWEVMGLVVDEYSHTTTGTEPILSQYVLIICHDCGEVKKKYL